MRRITQHRAVRSAPSRVPDQLRVPDPRPAPGCPSAAKTVITGRIRPPLVANRRWSTHGLEDLLRRLVITAVPDGQRLPRQPPDAPGTAPPGDPAGVFELGEMHRVLTPPRHRPTDLGEPRAVGRGIDDLLGQQQIQEGSRLGQPAAVAVRHRDRVRSACAECVHDVPQDINRRAAAPQQHRGAFSALLTWVQKERVDQFAVVPIRPSAAHTDLTRPGRTSTQRDRPATGGSGSSRSGARRWRPWSPTYRRAPRARPRRS